MQQTLRLTQRLAISPFRAGVSFTRSQEAELFKYTSGRWLYNEEEQNALRHVKFNVTEIQRVACDAIGAQRCITFKKLDEGSYNKVFPLHFDNGTEAIARIPCPLAGPPFLTTASEVATLEFAREVLGIRVPRIFAWSAQANANPVGAEYIIMEKISGVESRYRWLHLAKAPEVYPLLDGVFDIERSFERAPFSQIGSLYFKADVGAELQSRPLFRVDDLPDDDPELLTRLKAASNKYRVGPIADRQWWRAERAEMPLNRGPWPDMYSFLLAAADLERSWLHHSSQNTSLRSRHLPFHDVSTHLRLLDMYTQAIPHILPPFPLSRPTLWHPDISHSNLLIAPSGPGEIQGLIDWQHSTVAPYCMQATFPHVFTYDGGLIDIPKGRVPPKLPEYTSTLNPQEQQAHRMHLKLAMRHKVYEQKIVKENPTRMIACAMPFSSELALLPYQVLRSWSDSVVLLRQALLELQEGWKFIGSETIPCPISFTEEELREHEQEYRRYKKYQQSITSLDEGLCSGGDGWVSTKEYSRAMKTLRERRQAWDEESNGGPFPYEDGQFSFFLS